MVKLCYRRSGIRDPVLFFTPGSGMEKIQIQDPRVREKHPRSYVCELIKKKLGQKILKLKFFVNSVLRIRCLVAPGSRMEKSGSGISIPDVPQHWVKVRDW
jgi:hypothetical protein